MSTISIIISLCWILIFVVSFTFFIYEKMIVPQRIKNQTWRTCSHKWKVSDTHWSPPYNSHGEYIMGKGWQYVYPKPIPSKWRCKKCKSIKYEDGRIYPPLLPPPKVPPVLPPSFSKTSEKKFYS